MPHTALHELIALTQLYLLQNEKDWVFADKSVCDYFRNYAKNLRKEVIERPASAEKVSVTQTPIKEVTERPSSPEKVPMAQTPTAIVSMNAEVKTDSPIEPKKTIPVESLKKDTPTKTSFALELPAKVPLPEFQDFRAFMQQKFPSQVILDKIPTFEKEKKPMAAVILLSFDQNPKSEAFLQSIAKAIQERFFPAEVLIAQEIEKKNGWKQLLSQNTLKLILANPNQIESLPLLHAYYRENQKNATCFLGDVPLCLLSDLSLYWNQPQLKSTLWKEIQRYLGTTERGTTEKQTTEPVR